MSRSTRSRGRIEAVQVIPTEEELLLQKEQEKQKEEERVMKKIRKEQRQKEKQQKILRKKKQRQEREKMELENSEEKKIKQNFEKEANSSRKRQWLTNQEEQHSSSKPRKRKIKPMDPASMNLQIQPQNKTQLYEKNRIHVELIKQKKLNEQLKNKIQKMEQQKIQQQKQFQKRSVTFKPTEENIQMKNEIIKSELMQKQNNQEINSKSKLNQSDKSINYQEDNQISSSSSIEGQKMPSQFDENYSEQFQEQDFKEHSQSSQEQVKIDKNSDKSDKKSEKKSLSCKSQKGDKISQVSGKSSRKSVRLRQKQEKQLNNLIKKAEQQMMQKQSKEHEQHQHNVFKIPKKQNQKNNEIKKNEDKKYKDSSQKYSKNKQQSKVQQITDSLMKKLEQKRQTQKKVVISPITSASSNPPPNNSFVPIDQHFKQITHFKIYKDNKNYLYSTTLSKSDMEQNLNRFYVMQILQSKNNKEQFTLFKRYGRTGQVGNISIDNSLPLSKAIKEYREKRYEKFQKGYKQIQIHHECKKFQQNKTYHHLKRIKTDQPVSKLSEPVKSLMKLLFDKKMVTNQLKQIGLDCNKNPLGKLTKTYITIGYQLLKDIMDQLKRSQPRRDKINDLSSKFFSYIPHDFGMKNLAHFKLDNENKVKDKLEMLRSLQDIQIYTSMIKQIQEEIQKKIVNEMDLNYQKLGIQLRPLPFDGTSFGVINTYLKNTHAKTHNSYSLHIENVFQIMNQQQDMNFTREIHNHTLLWHGSRLTNYVGILSQGLRIAPSEAPSTGYMFGKGVYFADVVSKSANYCKANKNNRDGILLLCEVALGNSVQREFADSMPLLTKDQHSVKGVGKQGPQRGEFLGDVYVPNGQIEATGISNTSLLYNQYIVYDVNQIKCRYLVRVKFTFSS